MYNPYADDILPYDLYDKGSVQCLGFTSRYGGSAVPKTLDVHFCEFLITRGEIPRQSAFYFVGPTEHNEWNAYMKYNSMDLFPLDPYSRMIMDVAVKWTVLDLLPYISASVISSEQAVEGLDLSKNAGWPWSNTYPMKGCVLANRELLDWFENFYKLSFLTEHPIWDFTTTFRKGEMRKAEKAILDDIRTISGIDVFRAIVGNMSDHDFNQQFVHYAQRPWSTRWRPFSALGQNFFHGNFRMMVYNICGLDHPYYADANRHDSMMKSLLWYGVYCVREGLMTFRSVSEYMLFMNVQLRKMWCPTVLNDGLIMWRSSPAQDSGQSSTIVDNGLASRLRTTYCFLCMYWDKYHRVPTRDERDLFLREVHVGDDEMGSYASQLPWHLYPVYVWDHFGSFMKQNLPSKVDDVEFCSQHISFERGVALPAPDHAKFESSARLGNQIGGDNVVSSLTRISNLRLLAYPDKALFSLFDDYCRGLVAQYDSVLSGHPDWDAAKSQLQDVGVLHRFFEGVPTAQ